MNTRLKISLLALFLLSTVALFCATSLSTIPTLDVQPNPMEEQSIASCFFADKIPYQLVLVNRDEQVVKIVAEGVSVIGMMEFPIDRLDMKGEYIPSGKYWLTLNYQAKFTSTKKLLILK